MSTHAVVRADRGRAWGPTAVGLMLGAVFAPAALGVSTTAIALPALSADLGLSRPSAAWVLAGFLVTQAMLVPVFGRLGDLHGIRPSFAAGVLLVVAGSLGAATSGGFLALLLARLVHWAGCAAFWVSCQGLVGARFGPDDRPRALGAMLGVIGLVSGAGTLIGGVLTDALSWRGAWSSRCPCVLPCRRSCAGSGRLTHRRGEGTEGGWTCVARRS